MKRLFLLALIVFGLVAAQTASPAGDAQGPPCSNITDATRVYSAAGEIDVTLSLQDPVCSFVTYSVFVTDTDGNPLASSNCTPETTGEGCVDYVFQLGSGGPSTVCLYATTDIHGHLADRAPNSFDASCPGLPTSVSLTKSAAGADGGFN